MLKKNILALIGSASQQSVNQKIVQFFKETTTDYFTVTVCSDLKKLPHFDADLTLDTTPQEIVALRNQIAQSDGILICTPEYVFSLPSGLKNVIEWCVATEVFASKPTAIITASAHGEKGHEELQLIMQTVMSKLTGPTNLLISGAKGKVNESGDITDPKTRKDLVQLIAAFRNLVESTES